MGNTSGTGNFSQESRVAKQAWHQAELVFPLVRRSRRVDKPVETPAGVCPVFAEAAQEKATKGSNSTPPTRAMGGAQGVHLVVLQSPAGTLGAVCFAQIGARICDSEGEIIGGLVVGASEGEEQHHRGSLGR